MKTETKNPFENFLSVCRMHAQAGRISADIPLMYLHGDDPDDCYAIYQEWDETDNPTVWDARLKVTPADVAAEDLMKPWIGIIEMPPMKLKDMPESVMGTSVLARIKSLRKRRDSFAKMELERTDKPPEWLEELEGRPDKPAEFSAEKRDRDGLSRTPCLILCGSHEFGTQSYAGEMRFYRNPEDNVQVAIPNGMRWGTAVGNLKKVTEDLEFWISVRTDTTIEDLDMITEREIDSPFPPF